jgi:hypothetical protein
MEQKGKSNTQQGELNMYRIPLNLTVLLLISLLLGSQVASAQGEYTHPTGAFSMAEFGILVEEVDDGALFEDDGSMVMVLFGQASIEVTAETVPNVVAPMLNSVNEFDTYELLSDQVESFSDSFVIHFTHEPAGDYGEGDAFVLQDGEILYVMLLLTSDYEATFESWSGLLDSFTPGGYEAPVEEEPAPDEESGAEPAEEPVPQLDGVISSGFDPTTDGFGFENYGNDIPASNLTPTEMQRMFGDSVCANQVGASLEFLLQTANISQSIGTEIFFGTQYRPFLTNNVILQFGASALFPDDGFARIYDSDDIRYNAFTNILMTW